MTVTPADIDVGGSNNRNTSAFMKISAFPRKRSAPRFLMPAAATFAVSLLAARAAPTPQVGEAAPNFTLNTLEDKLVDLKQLTAKKSVVLVVLRGWPGYQ